MEFWGRVSCSEEGRGKNIFFLLLHVCWSACDTGDCDGHLGSFKLIRAGRR